MALPIEFDRKNYLLTIDTTKANILVGVMHPGINVVPLFLDPANGTWVVRAVYKAGTILPLHFHTGSVHFYTISGSWHYREYPNHVQTAGCYLYEPGGSIHQLVCTEETDSFVIVNGSNVNFHPDGTFIDVVDAGAIKQMVDTAAREQGFGHAEYIMPGSADLIRN